MRRAKEAGQSWPPVTDPQKVEENSGGVVKRTLYGPSRLKKRQVSAKESHPGVEITLNARLGTHFQTYTPRRQALSIVPLSSRGLARDM